MMTILHSTNAPHLIGKTVSCQTTIDTVVSVGEHCLVRYDNGSVVHVQCLPHCIVTEPLHSKSEDFVQYSKWLEENVMQANNRSLDVKVAKATLRKIFPNKRPQHLKGPAQSEYVYVVFLHANSSVPKIQTIVKAYGWKELAPDGRNVWAYSHPDIQLQLEISTFESEIMVVLR